MTEAEWAECQEPQTMLDWLQVTGKLYDRKARLFAVAVCRRIWSLLIDKRSRRAVETAERFADGRATERALQAAYNRAYDADEEIGEGTDSPAFQDAPGEFEDRVALEGAATAATTSASAKMTEAPALAASLAARAVGFKEPGPRWKAAILGEAREQAALLRCIFGNPFRPPTPLDPAWLAWGGGTVQRLAEAAYEERQLPSGHLDRARLAVLADTLEESGCGDASLLGHLRSPGPHVRGCAVIDALLGKS
jgi:hypothetical protein